MKIKDYADIHLLRIPLPFRPKEFNLYLLIDKAFYETLAHIINLENDGRIKRNDGAGTILFSLS